MKRMGRKKKDGGCMEDRVVRRTARSGEMGTIGTGTSTHVQCCTQASIFLAVSRRSFDDED